MARETQGGEEGREGSEEGGTGTFLAHHYTGSHTREVHPTTFQDICVAPQVLTASVNDSVRNICITN